MATIEYEGSCALIHFGRRPKYKVGRGYKTVDSSVGASNLSLIAKYLCNNQGAVVKLIGEIKDDPPSDDRGVTRTLLKFAQEWFACEQIHATVERLSSLGITEEVIARAVDREMQIERGLVDALNKVMWAAQSPDASIRAVLFKESGGLVSVAATDGYKLAKASVRVEDYPRGISILVRANNAIWVAKSRTPEESLKRNAVESPFLVSRINGLVSAAERVSDRKPADRDAMLKRLDADYCSVMLSGDYARVESWAMEGGVIVNAKTLSEALALCAPRVEMGVLERAGARSLVVFSQEKPISAMYIIAEATRQG